MNARHSANSVVVIGSGPSALTSALYCARELLDTTIVAGSNSGGQLMLTGDVENYPGFPEPIDGPELIERMWRQAERHGAKFTRKDVTEVDFSSRPFKVKVENDILASDAVVIATGSSAKWLGLESERRLIGRGVSSCAVCDAPLFKGAERAVVVGGGDTAMDEALTLAKFVDEVLVVHRRDELRASKALQERVFKTQTIKFLWNSTIEEILGDQRVESVLVEDKLNGKITEIKCKAVFIAIGYTPNTKIFMNQIQLDDGGYIVVKDQTKTSVPGVFAAGDVADHVYRQVATAVGLGCRAALDVKRYLMEESPSRS